MNESYKQQVKALQKAAGIRISEELAGYKAGVEMEEEYDVYEDGTDTDDSKYSDTPLEEKNKPLQGIEKLDPIIAGLKSAQDSMNALIADKDFTGKHKQKLQALSQELNNIQATLSNLASANLKNKKKEKTLEP